MLFYIPSLSYVANRSNSTVSRVEVVPSGDGVAAGEGRHARAAACERVVLEVVVTHRVVHITQAVDVGLGTRNYLYM